MCRPASFILTKDNVYWSLKTDSHEDIMDEYKLRDGLGGRVLIARVEIVPSHGMDVFSDIETWDYRLDQDRYPAWYRRARDEQRARNALREWHARRVLVGINDFHVVKDTRVWAKDSALYLRGNSEANAYGSCRIDLEDTSKCNAWNETDVVAHHCSEVSLNSPECRASVFDSAYVDAACGQFETFDVARGNAAGTATFHSWNYSHVTADGKASGIANGYSTVETRGYSKVSACHYSKVFSTTKHQVVGLYDSAIEILQVYNRMPQLFVASGPNRL
jgi:hypothetical protein